MPAPKPPPAIVQPAAAGAAAAAAPASPAAIRAGAPNANETGPKPAATAGSAVPGTAAPNGLVSGLRKPGQRPQAGPMESSLVSPQIAERPQPQATQPPPPPPRLAAVPTANGGATTHPPPPAAPAPPPIGATAFQPPPPPPVLVSPAPTGTVVTPPAGETRAPPVATATRVAEITFAAGSKSLSDGDLEALKKVAALYREHPGKLRVVGYVWAVDSADPLASFSTALDRAQAVAAALTKTGIPAAKIAVGEAEPAKAAADADRAEVLLEH
jgi:outer membrane protein OmpA-like peptidoglycan-associated protein